ncbi:mitochondrial carrier domain-containing protein [Choanephora cucurbitarum]|nr:mitochondrial carrier domain-containing protein [Choanephora cucurbitarum]
MDDYESLGADSTMTQNAIAGAMAGIGEHCIMYPVDSIRTRMQVPSSEKSFQKIQFRSQKHLWRGVYSVIIGAGPAHALHFTTYEFCKTKFTKKLDKETTFGLPSQLIVSGSAGAIATLSHDALMTPFDMVKQRMQLNDSTYRSVRDCITRVYEKEGIRAFYVSFPTTVSMSIPFQSIQFATYEYCRSKLNRQGEGYSPKAHVIAGAIAGMVASSITTPLDVIKTLLQTKGSSDDRQIRNTRGFREAAIIIYERYGLQGFFRGYKPRILTSMPSTAISWSVYEYFKWLLASNNKIEL